MIDITSSCGHEELMFCDKVLGKSEQCELSTHREKLNVLVRNDRTPSANVNIWASSMKQIC